MRVLTGRELNRAVLARQLLLERASLSVPRALQRVAGLQTQYAPTGYLGLCSRLAGFRRAELTDALHRGAAVQAWVMRSTIHMVSARDHALFSAAVREPRRRAWARAVRPPPDLDPAAAATALRGYLAAGPVRQADLQRRLTADGFPTSTWPGVQLWVDLVRVPPAGTWGTPRAHVYGLADLPDVPVEEAEEHLVTRYLGAFGPASAADVASFCGWSITAARAVLARLTLRRFRDETGGELVDVARAPLPSADVPAPVRFLGPWEALLLAHARRTQVLPERHRSKVFATAMPQSVPTFLVDGQVAGTWRHVAGEVHTAPFDPLAATDAAEVEQEAARLAAWYRDEDPVIG